MQKRRMSFASFSTEWLEWRGKWTDEEYGVVGMKTEVQETDEGEEIPDVE